MSAVGTGWGHMSNVRGHAGSYTLSRMDYRFNWYSVSDVVGHNSRG